MTSVDSTRVCEHCGATIPAQAYICSECGEWRSDAAEPRAAAKSWRLPTLIMLGMLISWMVFGLNGTSAWSSPAWWILAALGMGVGGLSDYYSRKVSKAIGQKYSVWSDW